MDFACYANCNTRAGFSFPFPSFHIELLLSDLVISLKDWKVIKALDDDVAKTHSFYTGSHLSSIGILRPGPQTEW